MAMTRTARVGFIRGKMLPPLWTRQPRHQASGCMGFAKQSYYGSPFIARPEDPGTAKEPSSRSASCITAGNPDTGDRMRRPHPPGTVSPG